MTLIFSNLKKFLDEQNKSALMLSFDYSKCHLPEAVQYLHTVFNNRVERNIDLVAVRYVQLAKILFAEVVSQIDSDDVVSYDDVFSILNRKLKIYDPITENQAKNLSIFLDDEKIKNVIKQYDLFQYFIESYQLSIFKTIELTFKIDPMNFKITHNEMALAMDQKVICPKTEMKRFPFGIFINQLNVFSEYREDLNAKDEFISRFINLSKEYIYASYYVTMDTEYKQLPRNKANLQLSLADLEDYKFEEMSGVMSSNHILQINNKFWDAIHNYLIEYGIMMPIGKVNIGQIFGINPNCIIEQSEIGLRIYLNILSNLINNRYFAKEIYTLAEKTTLEKEYKVPSLILFDALQISEPECVDLENHQGYLKSDRLDFIRNLIQLMEYADNIMNDQPIFGRSQYSEFIKATLSGPIIELNPAFIGRKMEGLELPKGAKPLLETGLVNIYALIDDDLSLPSYDLLFAIHPKMLDLAEQLAKMPIPSDFICDPAYEHVTNMQKHYIHKRF